MTDASDRIRDIQRARWEGGVEGRLNELTNWKASVNGDIRDIKEEQVKIAVAVGEIKTKVALWSAIGGICGAGVVGVVIRLVG